MTKKILIIAALLFCTVAAAELPQDILLKTDEIRNPSQSYAMKIRLEDSLQKGVDFAYEVSVKGNDKTFIKTLAPARDRGRNMLMLSEDMWLYIPNLKRSVRVSLSQKLSGQAANGDISRMRWSGDYDSSIEKEDMETWTLLLKARKKGLTYDQLRVWVEKKTYRPIKAEFLSLSGKVLKRAYYEDFKTLAGKSRPGRIRIVDAIRESDYSNVLIDSMENREFSDAQFNQDALE